MWSIDLYYLWIKSKSFEESKHMRVEGIDLCVLLGDVSNVLILILRDDGQTLSADED